MLLILLAAAAAAGVRELPPEWRPWAPIIPSEGIGPFTQIKLARLDGPACLAYLSAFDQQVRSIPDRRVDDQCGWTGAIRVGRPGLRMEPAGPTLACSAAASLALWIREVVQPQAQARLGSRVTVLRHLGTYACRPIAGSTRYSQHARANAIDIAAFDLADGRSIRVARDWRREGPQGDFLRAAHDGACSTFSTVLGPAYNAAHRDHLHLDRGLVGICR